METKTGESEPRSRAEKNKEVVKRWTDALERRAFDEAVGCWAPDAVNHASGRTAPAPSPPEAIRRLVDALRVAFPDRRWRIDDMIAEGDQVACRMTVSGTFGATPVPPGPLPAGYLGLESTMLVPASAAGKPYSVKHIHIFRIAGGMIAEHWAARDDLSLLLQLGAIAGPP